jgi:hypothetical protein
MLIVFGGVVAGGRTAQRWMNTVEHRPVVRCALPLRCRNGRCSRLHILSGSSAEYLNTQIKRFLDLYDFYSC